MTFASWTQFHIERPNLRMELFQAQVSCDWRLLVTWPQSSPLIGPRATWRPWRTTWRRGTWPGWRSTPAPTARRSAPPATSSACTSANTTTTSRVIQLCHQRRHLFECLHLVESVCYHFHTLDFHTFKNLLNQDTTISKNKLVSAGARLQLVLELETNIRKDYSFTITDSWLKPPISFHFQDTIKILC